MKYRAALITLLSSLVIAAPVSAFEQVGQEEFFVGGKSLQAQRVKAERERLNPVTSADKERRYEEKELTWVGFSVLDEQQGARSFSVRTGISELSSEASAGVEFQLTW